MMFRTYDPAWNRTGWADEPQYSGQPALTQDFPLKCPSCGKQDIVSVGLTTSRYMAACRCGQQIEMRPIEELTS